MTTADTRIATLEDAVRKLQRALAIALIAIGIVLALLVWMRFGVVKTRGIAVVDGAGKTVVTLGVDAGRTAVSLSGDAPWIRLFGPDGKEQLSLSAGATESSVTLAGRVPESSGFGVVVGPQQTTVKLGHTSSSVSIAAGLPVNGATLQVTGSKSWTSLTATDDRAAIDAMAKSGEDLVMSGLGANRGSAEVRVVGFNAQASMWLNPITGPEVSMLQSEANAKLGLYKGKHASFEMRAAKGSVAMTTGYTAPSIELSDPNQTTWTTKKP